MAENGDLIFTGQNKVGSWESWLLRMSPDGTVVYDLGYGDAGTLGGAAHEVLEHNVYTYMYMDNGDATVALVKLDALGDTITVKQYQGNNTKYMLLSEDANSLYLLGITNNASTYLLKTDLEGDTIWTKHFYNLNGHALIEKEDSIYILGAPPSGGNGGYDVALMKLASDGSSTNCYEYDFTEFFYNPYSIVITPYGENILSIPLNDDVTINNNIVDYNKCVNCISTNFSYQVDNLEVFFTNESTLEVDYNWDFGDNNSDSNYNTSHQFSSTGSYEVCLLASDSCSSELVCQTIEITDCQSKQSNTVIITCDSTYQWNGTTYNQSGQYTYTTTNSNGCDSTATLNLSISEIGIETIPSINGPNAGVTQSQGNEYTITNAVLGSTYHWSITPNLGEIISSNNDSSVVEILWGAFEGFTDLCAYEEDQYGCIGISRCVEVQIKSPTSINENTTIDFELFPNPFTNQTVLELKNNNGENVEIKIVDLNGKIIRIYKKTENNRIIIKRNGLANGIYYLNILTENGQAKELLIIK